MPTLTTASFSYREERETAATTAVVVRTVPVEAAAALRTVRAAVVAQRILAVELEGTTAAAHRAAGEVEDSQF
ncbi:hypothetical protein QN219_22340 [Sinorhizobium sp. 7-81]|uniref:hypothetical protein n=1 Tax=Sinorhizobium sp. 8-89 TaxID=3049089 RepID=UPI0024C26A9D|nr:hypothetical protein [Sinorhizobium sp. 8-89]MDK1492769.1 hypothetical protein [Sinorhizobium sp. 8-89]